MPYFPVDDDMPFHPKVLAAGNEAIGMWTRAGALCKKHTTGGFVSDATVTVLGGSKLASRLVLAGLWVQADGGYRFHDWKQQAGNDDAHVEKERAEKARERNAARQSAWRGRNAESNGVTNASVTDTPSPSPSPSDFYSPSKSQSRSNRARVSTDAIEIPEMTRKLAAQRGVTSLRAVVDAVARHTGLDVDASGALRVSLWILDKRKDAPDAPQRYVTGAISKSAPEVQQFIHAEALEVA